MSASSFAELIIGKLESAIGKDGTAFTENTPSIANKAIANAVTEYLIKNTKITVQYTGMIPGTPPVPDPTVIDVLEIEGNCEPPSIADNFNTWISDLGSKIQSGFFLGKGKAGVVTTKPKSVNCFIGVPLLIDVTEIKSIHLGNLENTNDPQKVIWEYICNKIILWLCGIRGIPFSGKNDKTGSKGTGTTTITLVS